MEKHIGDVANVDPRHPLIAFRDAASQTKLKNRRHYCERSIGTKYYGDPNAYDPRARCHRFLSFGLPSLTDLGQKLAGVYGAPFRSLFLAAVSIDPNGRGADQNFRRVRCTPDRFNDAARPFHPALEDALFLRLGPNSQN